VVACAVMLPDDVRVLGLADSKLLSDALRRRLLPRILESALSYGLGVVDPAEIDRVNILQATFSAMRLALARIDCDALIVDGGQVIPGLGVHQHAAPRADATSVSVAAASIVAKVTRDDLMKELESRYPGYGFASHKGYATRAHFEALDRLGPCAAHRQSFLVRWRERRAQTTLAW
jgi:ribonuclease HII